MLSPRIIADTLDRYLLGRTGLSRVHFHGLVDSFRSDRSTIELAVSGCFGEPRPVFPDDAFDLVTWHRSLGLAHAESQTRGRGDANVLESTATMRLVGLVNVTRLQLSPDELAYRLFALLHRTQDTTLFKFAPSQYRGIVSRPYCVPRVMLSDRVRVCDTEFAGLSLAVGPEIGAFSVEYTLTTSLSSRCFPPDWCNPDSLAELPQDDDQPCEQCPPCLAGVVFGGRATTVYGDSILQAQDFQCPPQ